MIKPNKQYVFVEIDKEEQKRKQETFTTKGGLALYLASQFIYMKHNLQYGPITAIGDNIKNLFPEIEIGDLGIFNHKVETGEHNLIETLANGNEIRAVKIDPTLKTELLYGIIKDGTLIPYPKYVFFNPEVKIIADDLLTSLITTDAALWTNPDYLMQKQDELKKEFEARKEGITGLNPYIKSDLIRIEENTKRLDEINAEMVRVTAFLNKAKLATGQVMYVHPCTSRIQNINPAQQCLVNPLDAYPIEIAGNEFKIYPHGYVIATFN